ncbi:MAG: motility associated factor glycosyltransferase family protein [Myxococcales bacterium]|nr:motility associated factor glycosyltransferase family protein [Myxococcales bacterium]
MVPGEPTLWRRLRRAALTSLRGSHAYFRFESRHARINPELASLRGSGKGKRCVIMGGGPSLKAVDPDLLKDEVTFGVNGIFLIEDWLGFLPTYYVVEDALVVEDRADAIASLEGPTKIYGSVYRNRIRETGDVRYANVLYDYSAYPEFPYFSADASRCLWVGGTVSYLCLQLAYYMEFDPVILVGFDHNYSEPADVVKGSNQNEWTSQSDDPNHFHPDYFGKGKRWHAPRTDRMELAYQKARAEFDKVGRKVINATEGGKLEVFERVPFDMLFARKVGQ